MMKRLCRTITFRHCIFDNKLQRFHSQMLFRAYLFDQCSIELSFPISACPVWGRKTTGLFPYQRLKMRTMFPGGLRQSRAKCFPIFPSVITVCPSARCGNYLSLVVRNPVFGFYDQVRHKQGCAVTEDSQRLEISDL